MTTSTQEFRPADRPGTPTDHTVERPAPGVAVVSDRGLRRVRNEDAGRVATAPGWVGLVVCDGVGSTPGSDRASSAAADVGRDALAAARAAGRDLSAQLTESLEAAAWAAVQADDRAVEDSVPAPATTFAAAASDGRRVAVTSVGDSRVYWVPDGGGAVALTTDDSYAAAQIALGIPADAAEHGPYAHVITRWLGADGPAVEGRVRTYEIDGPGWLIACSDGLWGYLPPRWGLGTLTAGSPDDGLTLAERFVAWANLQGGRDNITVALARIHPAAAVSGQRSAA